MFVYHVGNEGLMSVSVEQEKYFAAIVSATPSGLSWCTSWLPSDCI